MTGKEKMKGMMQSIIKRKLYDLQSRRQRNDRRSEVYKDCGVVRRLFYGGCHGSDEREVSDHLCRIVEETIDLYKQDGKSLPHPLSARDLVNALQRVA
jgi:hypothetical protein